MLLNNFKKELNNVLIEKGLTKVEASKLAGFKRQYITVLPDLDIVAKQFVHLWDVLGYDIKIEYISKEDDENISEENSSISQICVNTSKFPEMLQYLRKSRGYTQATLSDATGLNRSTIANYENGHRGPGLENLIFFADFFKVSISTLLGRTDDFHLPEDTLSESAKALFLSLQNASDEEIEQATKVINALRK